MDLPLGITSATRAVTDFQEAELLLSEAQTISPQVIPASLYQVNMLPSYPSDISAPNLVHHTGEDSPCHDDVSIISPDDFIVKPSTSTSSSYIPSCSLSSIPSNRSVPAAVAAAAAVGTPTMTITSTVNTCTYYNELGNTEAVVVPSTSHILDCASIPPTQLSMPKVIIVKPPVKSKSSTNKNNKGHCAQTVSVDIPALSAQELTMIVKGGGGRGGEGASSDMKIFMSGASMRINGELATVIFNKSLNADVVQFEAPNVVTSHQPKQPSTANSLKRTVGISTDNNVPVEIVPAAATSLGHIQSKPAGAVQEVIMQRQSDNTIKFVLAEKPRTIYDKDVCRVYSSGNSYGALHSLSNNSRDTQTTEDDCYNFDAFKKQYLPLSCKYSYKFVSHCKENDTIEFRVRGIETKKLIKEWIDVVGNLSHTQYKVWKTYKPQKDNTYRYLYRCHMNQGRKTLTLKGKNLGCESRLVINIGPESLSRGCRVRYRITHNHTVEQSAKHYSVNKDIKDKILQMFREGKGVSDAYTLYFDDLKGLYGERYNQIQGNRSIAPNRSYFYNVWREYSKSVYGKLMRPPKSSAPKVPWNKGLRGVSSLKEFLPVDEQDKDNSAGRNGKGKKERIREVAIEGIETTLLDSVKQCPEVYSKAVTCFVDSWRAMDERERLHWLQTRIEREIPEQEPVTMYEVAQAVADHQQQLDETQVATNKLSFMDEIVESQGYSDIVVAQHHHQQTLQVAHHDHHSRQHHVVMTTGPQQIKRRKTSSHKLDTELSLAVSDSTLSYYLTHQ